MHPHAFLSLKAQRRSHPFAPLRVMRVAGRDTLSTVSRSALDRCVSMSLRLASIASTADLPCSLSGKSALMTGRRLFTSDDLRPERGGLTGSSSTCTTEAPKPELETLRSTLETNFMSSPSHMTAARNVW